MKITIDIPKEFEAHFAEDRFKDSLMRLAADRHSLAGKYEYELVEMLIRAFKDATCMESKQEDLISMKIQEILDYLDNTLHPIISPDNWNVYSELHDMVSELPSAQFAPCQGCKYLNIFEGDDGYQTPCRLCKRGAEDYYER